MLDWEILYYPKTVILQYYIMADVREIWQSWHYWRKTPSILNSTYGVSKMSQGH